MRKVILFQGDSITDCGRGQNCKDGNLGHGYATVVSGNLGAQSVGEYTFYNRGISGNRIVDVYARIKRDIINLKPDYMSILIGINDVWHEYGEQNGVATEKFERIYNMLIEEIKEALPNIKIMILEPFVLEGSATENTEEHPARFEYFVNGANEKRAAVKRVAEKNGLTFVPLFDVFNAADKENKGVWSGDGVHPSALGHGLIATEWLKAFNKIK